MLLPGAAFGHAAFVDISESRAITIRAAYDTGEPMVGAQVAVYAPDAPTEPWSTGLTGEDGTFTFVPDDRAGRWAVQARQAGHGAISYVDWQPGEGAVVAAETARQGHTSTAQRLLMIASVAWGCIGTALYFRRRPGGMSA